MKYYYIIGGEVRVIKTKSSSNLDEVMTKARKLFGTGGILSRRYPNHKKFQKRHGG